MKTLSKLLMLVLTSQIYFSCSKKKDATPSPPQAVTFSSYADVAINDVTPFFSSSTGQFYTPEQAKANQAIIDWGYYWSANDGPGIGAPDSSGVSTVSSYHVNTWTTKNATRFYETSLSITDFNAINTDTAILHRVNKAKLVDKSHDNLDYFPGITAFITASGKIGLIRIQSFDLAQNTVKFAVKVQK